jgi:hypothetical protein
LRYRSNKNWLWIVLVIIGAGLLGLLTWGNYHYAKQNPGGNDFLVHWVGTRALIRDGLSPYSDETTLRIQSLAYGRPALPGEHELRVAYPLYSVVVFLPFALFSDFALARALWMTALEVGLGMLAFFSIRLANWRPGLVSLVIFFLFTFLWYHAVRPLINGNAVILIALGLVAGLLALRSGADEFPGVLFAFTTIKPQVVVVFILFILIWAIAQRRWRIIIWFFATLVLLCGAAALLLPDWMMQNLHEILRYSSYNPPGTPGSALNVWMPGIGRRLGLALSGILVAILIIEWWFSRNATFRQFYWVACLTLVVSLWIGIQTDPGNFIVAFPAIVLVFSVWEERWRKGGRFLSIITMLVLLVGIWLLFINTITYGYQPQQSPVMFFPLPGILLILMYWVRWWAIRPPNAWFDLLYSQEHSEIL